jgi:hypothetical protein
VATRFKTSNLNKNVKDAFLCSTLIESDYQGCQIFLGATYQNGKKIIPHNLPIGRRIYQMEILNIPASSIARHSKIYPKKDFCFENTILQPWSRATSCLRLKKVSR